MLSRIIMSRKGFDSSAGGTPSPIVNGIARSMPIPEASGLRGRSYRDLGLAYVDQMPTRFSSKSLRRICADDVAHSDPCSRGDRVFLGHSGGPVTSLERQRVGPGDLFLFFGVFSPQRPDAPNYRRGSHHRIFGWMLVDQVTDVGRDAQVDLSDNIPADHPHRINDYGRLNAIYSGPGKLDAPASDKLQLTAPDQVAWSFWSVPDWWLRSSIFGKSARTTSDGRYLNAHGQWQEMIVQPRDEDIGSINRWAAERCREVGGPVQRLGDTP